jgi:GT2 family glycosyltransferase
MATQITRFSIVILAHNRLDLLKRMLKSLNTTMARPDVETHVLDNGSGPDVAKYLATVPYIRRTNSQINLGVAAGRQLMIENLPLGEIVIFLDSDVYIEQDNWIEQLYMVMEPENVGVAGPAGSFINWNEPGLFVPSGEGQCDVVSGWCLGIKREVIQAGVKLRIEDFPMFWCEDSALCLDTYNAGWDVWCSGYIGVKHTPGLSGDEPGLKEQAERRFREMYQGAGLTRGERVPWAK